MTDAEQREFWTSMIPKSKAELREQYVVFAMQTVRFAEHIESLNEKIERLDQENRQLKARLAAVPIDDLRKAQTFWRVFPMDFRIGEWLDSFEKVQPPTAQGFMADAEANAWHAMTGE